MAEPEDPLRLYEPLTDDIDHLMELVGHYEGLIDSFTIVGDGMSGNVDDGFSHTLDD
jgi:hypothetical protein